MWFLKGLLTGPFDLLGDISGRVLGRVWEERGKDARLRRPIAAEFQSHTKGPFCMR